MWPRGPIGRYSYRSRKKFLVTTNYDKQNTRILLKESWGLSYLSLCHFNYGLEARGKFPSPVLPAPAHSLFFLPTHNPVIFSIHDERFRCCPRFGLGHPRLRPEVRTERTENDCGFFLLSFCLDGYMAFFLHGTSSSTCVVPIAVRSALT